MRVLFTTWASPGHYFPMVPLAWALRAAGHEVRMTSQPELLPVMGASGLPVTAIGRDFDVAGYFQRERAVTQPARANNTSNRAEKICDDLLARLDTAGLEHSAASVREIEAEARSTLREIWSARAGARPSSLAVYGEVAQAMADDLLGLAKAWRPDLIVYDGLTYAGPLVATLLGVPAVRMLFGPDNTYFATAAADVPGWVDLLATHGLRPADVDLLGVSSVDPCPPSLQVPDSALAVHRIRTRYVAYNGPSEVPRWLTEPQEQRRLCLTWGTSAHQLLGEQGFLPGEVLTGAAKLADGYGAELALAITTSQRELLPPDVPSNVRVVESVPLDALLPTCQAIVHQGGAGTILNALRHGLPQIVLPQRVDQVANACHLVATGAGRTRAAAGLTAADLLAAGHAVLDDPAYRASAQRVRQEIADQRSPAEVVDDLAGLIR